MNDKELSAKFHAARNAERKRLQAGRTSESIEYEEWLRIHPRTDVAGLRAVAAKAWAEAIQAAASARLTEVTFPLNATFDANPYKARP